MRNKVYCDYCGNLLNEEGGELITLLHFMGEDFLFCDDVCMCDYFKFYAKDAHISYDGSSEE